MGTIALNMSAIQHGEISALLGKTRRAILSLLFTRSDEAFYYRQIERLTGGSPGAIQRELRNLTDAGLLIRERRGNQVYYRANVDSPIFPELRSIVVKTVGLADVVRDALAPVSDRITFSFIYGSFANGRERSTSDVDLIIVGDVRLREIISHLRGASEELRREINPTIFSYDEFSERAGESEGFVRRVIDGPKIMLIGDERDLKKLG
jgi:DNA-binding transcriptional ArsR family regulator